MSVVHMASIESGEDGFYVVTFPDVPAAITQGATFEEALANAREALELVLEASLEDSGPLPSRPTLSNSREGSRSPALFRRRSRPRSLRPSRV